MLTEKNWIYSIMILKTNRLINLDSIQVIKYSLLLNVYMAEINKTSLIAKCNN